MLEQPMIEKLLSMRLQGMADALKAQEQDAGVRELSFVERLSLLVDQQWNWRENQALARRLKSAKLRHNACIEDIDYRAARGLEKTIIRGLAKDSQWVQNHENLFVLGPTGVGKSYIAGALAQKACRDGYSAYYTRAAALFRDLALARADGSFRSLLARMSRIDVLALYGPTKKRWTAGSGPTYCGTRIRPWQKPNRLSRATETLSATWRN